MVQIYKKQIELQNTRVRANSARVFYKDHDLDTYLRYMSLVRMKSFWSFTIRQRYIEIEKGAFNFLGASYLGKTL